MNERLITLDVIELSDFYLPHLIDLNAFFVASNLHFQAEMNRRGIVELDSITSDGILFLNANMKACSGERTRVTIRAVDLDGHSIATSFEVVVVDLSVVAA